MAAVYQKQSHLPNKKNRPAAYQEAEPNFFVIKKDFQFSLVTNPMTERTLSMIRWVESCINARFTRELVTNEDHGLLCEDLYRHEVIMIIQNIIIVQCNSVNNAKSVTFPFTLSGLIFAVGPSAKINPRENTRLVSNT